ncbi:MAG: hypothetical protein IPK16_27090 [Anaerolineales bacterium]|nr:hypothetical protein [Anaerolineales bacterium]
MIDDAWQVEAAEALRCSGPGISHLMTTRNEEIARTFVGAGQAVKVPVLGDTPAWELLQALAPEACVRSIGRTVVGGSTGRAPAGR